MGETVTFPSNGSTASGYLATPASGSGPGVLVLQEWWGLVPQVKRVADRLAGEGFTALAPDLYHGEAVDYTPGQPASHTEMDKAGALMNGMPPDRAARDMSGAIEYLLAHEAVQGAQVGVIGFCMGGMLSLLIAANAGDRVGAAAPWYGAPTGDMEPDWSALSAPVEGHFAENDSFFTPEAMRAVEKRIQDAGKDATFHFYPGTGHAFGNEDNALGTHDSDAAGKAWSRSVDFLRKQLVK